MRPLPWLILLAMLIALVAVSCIARYALLLVEPRVMMYEGNLSARGRGDYSFWASGDVPILPAPLPAAAAPPEETIHGPATNTGPSQSQPVVEILVPSQEPTATASPSPTPSPSPTATVATARPVSVSTRTLTRVPTAIVQTLIPTPTRNIGYISPSLTPISNPGDVTATVPATSTPTPTTTHTPTTTPTRTATPTLTKTTGNVATPTQIVISTSTATATATATATPAVTLAFASSAISANEAQGVATAVVNVSIQPAGASRTNTVSVHYATSNGSAKAGVGQDYLATSGTLYFPPGINTAAITMTILPDAIKERDEIAFITLSAPSGATFGGTETATLTIIDASAPPVVNLVADAGSVSESVGRTAFWIVLSQPSAYDVTVPYIIGGSAMAGSDYSGLSSGTVVVPAGVQKVRLPFAIINDQVAENVETISATLGSPTNASRGTSAIITVTDNDTAGVYVSALSGTSTSESGGSITFSVWLNSQPTANVIVPITSGDTTEGTVSPTILTFTAANWKVLQTVTVTGVNDFVVDGPITYAVQLVPAVSTDPFYGGKFARTIGPLTNDDNDVGGVNVEILGSSSTSEAGGSVTLKVWLNSEPTANVTIPITSNDLTEGTVSPASLTFTPTTWDAAQLVTVTGADDFVDDGNIAYTVSVGPASDADAIYRSVAARTVNLTNIDNDTAGITADPVSGAVTEGGATATIRVALDSQPTDTVVITATADAKLYVDGLASTVLTITPDTWNTARIITVSAVDDLIAEGPHSGNITFSVDSADPLYRPLTIALATVQIIDNDVPPDLTILAQSGTTTSENLDTVTFKVALTRQPLADVTVPISSDNVGEGTVGPASLIFTAANWNVPQTVTVTGVNDAVADGDRVYRVQVGPTSSSSAVYNGLGLKTITLTNIDNDSAGVIVTPATSLSLTEGGQTSTYTVELGSQPIADVMIAVSADAQLRIGTPAPTLSALSLTFTPGNWNQPQTVTVSAFDDAIAENPDFRQITHSTASADPNYNAMTVARVGANITDNDTAGITVSPTSGLVTTESGGPATFGVALTSEPTANVTIALDSSNTAEGTVSPASMTFTAANWSVPQTVTVTGVDDFVVDGPVAYTVSVGPTSSADPFYSGMAITPVSLSNSDNDTAGVNLSATSGTTSEAGGTMTFSVWLNSQPTATVSIPLISSNTTEGTVSPASLTFTPTTWNTPQTVTVTGVDDFVVDGNINYTVTVGPTSSTDLLYGGTLTQTVNVVNLDNDTAGMNISATTGTTSEAGGTTTFSVWLNSQPTATVTIPLVSSDTTEGVVSPASLTFTAANWNVPQIVTVTGVDDFVVDGNMAYSVNVGPTSGGDPLYNNTFPKTVSLTNLDNDTAGVNISATTGTTSEAGGTATFSVWLNSEPTADVIIPLASSDTTEGVVSPASLTFTAANWNVPQTVTVTGVDDFVVDGNINYTVGVGPATGGDPLYNGSFPKTVSLVNLDNDVAGVNISTTTGTTSEAGGAATFSVWLNSEPTADVTIPLASSDTTEGAVSPASLTFTAANWNVPQTVTVTGVDDFVVDGNINYTVGIGPASGSDPLYNGSFPKTVSLVNLDNDTANVTITNVTLPEGNAGTTAFIFTVNLSNIASRDVIVDYTTVDQTATVAGNDYTAATGTLTIPAGSLSGTITVNVTGDTIPEPDKTFLVRLSNLRTSGVGAIAVTLAGAQGTGMITNDDFPTVSIGSPASNEGNGLLPNVVMNFPVTLSAPMPTGYTMVVNYGATANGTATAGSDYTFVPAGTFTFIANGVTVQTIPVTILGDTIFELDETFSISLTSATVGVVAVPITSATGTGTILNDDTLTASINSVSQNEGNGPGTTPMNFTVSLNAQASAITAPVTVNYGPTVSGTAFDTTTAAGAADYTPLAAGFVIIGAGTTSQAIPPVAIIGDTTYELNETFTLTLTGTSAGVISATNGTGTGTILNDDTLTASIDSPSQAEGNGTGTMNFTVSLNAQASAITAPVTVNYGATVSGTAFDTTTAAGAADYTPLVAGTVNIGIGATSQTIVVPIIGDTTYEANETFTLTLTSASAGAISLTNGTGTGTILNDDSSIKLKITDVTLAEGTSIPSATTAFTFTVSLDYPADAPVNVTYKTANLTAAAGSDYTATSGTLIIPTTSLGNTTGTITVTVIGDAIPEQNETFAVQLLSLTYGTIPVVIADNQGLGTITNDDGTIPMVGFSAVTYSVGKTDGNAVLRVRLSMPAPSPISVPYTLVNGTAIAPTDYTNLPSPLNFIAGEIEKTILVPIIPVATAQPDKVFTVVLGTATGATLDPARTTATVAIIDDDKALPTADAGFLQTAGPNYLNGNQWNFYASGGTNYTYMRIDVPCGVTSPPPVQIDLHDAGMNTASVGASNNSAISDEVVAPLVGPPGAPPDNTTFNLYKMPTGWSYDASGLHVPAPALLSTYLLQTVNYLPDTTSGLWNTFATISATASPVIDPTGCGTYLLRASVSDNDVNGWGIRVGWQVVAPTVPPTAPNAHSSVAALPGSGDEISVGILQNTLRHIRGLDECTTFYEYVSPGQATATFNNYDLDYSNPVPPPAMTARVRYYPPSSSYDPLANTGGIAGAASINGEWNGGNAATRGGDVVANPESGWWRIVTCTDTAGSQNQYIQEGQTDQASYTVQPGTPALDLSLTSSSPTVLVGNDLTFTANYTNTSSGITAGAAVGTTFTVTLPINLTYKSCSGASSCTLSTDGRTLTITVPTVVAGAPMGNVTFITTAGTPTGPVGVSLLASYKDVMGNPFVGSTGRMVSIQ